MTIILIGYMGSGKSTIGQKLSKMLKYAFIDLDAYIQDKEGKSIPEIFATNGEIYFRKIESRYLIEVLAFEDSIISLGGGTPCYGNNISAIKTAKHSQSIYLKASIPTLVERLFGEKSNRPLISHLNSKDELTEFLGKHLFERTAFYSQSDMTLSVDGKSVDEIVEDVILRLF